MKIIVSSGGTREAIDSVRFISNVSTGSTGAALAEALAQHGHEIVQLRGQGSVVAEDVAESKSFSSAQDLWELLRQELGTGTIDAVIMCAAVADYRPEAETPGKIRSDAEQLVLRLVRNPKLLPQLKACSPKPLKVVGFKFTVGEEATQGLSAVQRQWTAGGVDAVVQNDLREIQASKVHPFWFYKDPAQAPERILGARALAAKLDEFLVGKKERPKPETARPKLKSSLRCLLFNIGNTTLLGGVSENGKIVSQFRIPIKDLGTKQALAKKLDRRVRGRFDRVVFCSVVPALTPRVESYLEKKTGLHARLLNASAPHGLKIGYRQPKKLGTDRLAAILGARALMPDKNLIVVDCGTATTVTALTRKGVLCGGAIFPGLGLWAEVLAARTAQLPKVAPKKPKSVLGRSPREAIASGLFYGHAGAVKELVVAIAKESFGKEPYLVLGTGGMSPRFDGEKLFTKREPELILLGLQSFAVSLSEHA